MQKIKRSILRLLISLFLLSLVLLLSGCYYSDEEIEVIKREAYNKGYDVGYDQGHNIGYFDGHDKGRSDGYDDGYNTGYDKGYSIGYDEGFADGKKTTQKKTASYVASSSSGVVSQSSYIVYITKTGSKYHRYGCSYLRESCIAIDYNNIKYTHSPCSRCNP